MPIAPWLAAENKPDLPPWLSSLWDYVRRDPFGGLTPGVGVLTGPAKRALQSASPVLARHLGRVPTEVNVRASTKIPFGGTTSAFKTVTPQSGPVPDLIRITLRPGEFVAPVHEGLHAAYFAKGLYGYPPLDRVYQIVRGLMKRNPELSSPGVSADKLLFEYAKKVPYKEVLPEAAIELMAQNMLRRGQVLAR